ncbi:MAG TPA: hypothetical protein VN823_23255 [Stellaceae bacterium]|nr:hypothetical protein [Stellaceae bacterium]
MTSLAIVDGWNMTSTGPEGRHGRGAWREVVVAWAAAAVLAGALVLSLPSHRRESSSASPWSLAPAAGVFVHQDDEDPPGDEACTDRDYANERC